MLESLMMVWSHPSITLLPFFWNFLFSFCSWTSSQGWWLPCLALPLPLPLPFPLPKWKGSIFHSNDVKYRLFGLTWSSRSVCSSVRRLYLNTPCAKAKFSVFVWKYVPLLHSFSCCIDWSLRYTRQTSGSHSWISLFFITHIQLMAGLSSLYI